MTKPLSELLEAVEPHPIAKDATLVPRASYDRMKAVAIELAKALEFIMRDMPTKAKEKFDKNEVTYFCEEIGADVLDVRFEHAITCRESLTRARSLLEGEK